MRSWLGVLDGVLDTVIDEEPVRDALRETEGLGVVVKEGVDELDLVKLFVALILSAAGGGVELPDRDAAIELDRAA